MFRNVLFQVANRLSVVNLITTRSTGNAIDVKVISRKRIGYKNKTKNQLIRQKDEKLKNITSLLNEPYLLENSEALEKSLIDDSMDRRTAVELTETHKRERKRLKYLIWQKKYMKETPEFGVLTWPAKEQIRYLHETDSEKWTFEVLADHFPITAKGVRKLLNSTFNMHSKEQVLRHDQKVKIKWENIISQNDYESLHSGYKWLFNEGKSSLFVYANGNPNLPVPPKSYIELSDDRERKRPAGPYESLVKAFYLTESLKDQRECVSVDVEMEALSKEFGSIINVVKEAIYCGALSESTDLSTADGARQSELSDLDHSTNRSASESEFGKFLKLFSSNQQLDKDSSQKKVLTLKNEIHLDFSKRLLHKYL